MRDNQMPIIPRISLVADVEDYQEWGKMSKKIRGKRIMIQGAVARFLLHKLADDEKVGFKDLKKFI